ncbi:MAG: hypothetical protein RTV72_16845 [Candidatus Thorarchaeota archaeon]
MVRLQIKTGIILVFLALFMTGTLLVSLTSANDFELSQDDIKPNIWAWGYTGRPNESEAFSVWANVTKNEAGPDIANVTINVLGPNVTIHDPLSFNGTLYVGDVDAFPNPGDYWLQIIACDLNGTSRTSGFIIITIEVEGNNTVDPILTLPIVVSTSMVVVVIVIISALMYDKKQIELAESTTQPDNGSVE